MILRREGSSRSGCRLGVVLLGGLVLLAGVFWIQARREDRLFGRFVEATVRAEMSDSEKSVALMHGVHRLLAPRTYAFAGDSSAFDRWLPASLTRILIEGGACGAQSRVLARALQVAGLEARLVQLRVAGFWGAHIVAAARVDSRWVPLDPLLDVALTDADGRLADIEAVSRAWESYAPQIPEGNRHRVDYREFRYTNWEQVPVLLPAVRTGLGWVLGEERVGGLSLRAHVLNVHRLYALACLALGVALCWSAGWRAR